MPLDDDPISAYDIPNVTKLCESAGFEGDSRDELKNSTRAYALHRYMTQSGLPGTGLREWGSKTVRYELGLMAQDFLDVGGYGAKYWGASTRRALAYPRNKIL